MHPRVSARPFLGFGPRRSVAFGFGLGALLVPGTAVAADVVLPPLVPRTGTEVRDVANLTALLSTELDFMPEVENVIELPKIPTTLTTTCLDQPGCLGAIGKQAGGSHLVAGSLRVTPEKVTIDLVYFDVVKGRVVRRQAFDLVNKPEIIADNMDDVVRELLTGEAPKAVAAAETTADSFNLLDFDEDEDINFDQDDFAAAAKAEAAKKAAAEAEAAKKAAAAEAARKAEEQARAEAARRAAEEQARAEAARRAAEAEAARKAEEQARAEAARRAAAEEQARVDAARRAAAAEAARQEAAKAAAAEAARQEAAKAAAARPTEDEFDPSMISFGSAAIIVEEEPAQTRPVQTPVVASKPSYYDEEEPEELAEPSLADLDIEAEDTDYKPAPKPTSARPPAKSSATDDGVERIGTSRPDSARTEGGRTTQAGSTASFDDAPTAVQIALRGGYSPYYNLGFVTAGGEVSVSLGGTGVHLVGGVEAWNVNRQIPPEYQVLAGRTTEWNTIFPVSCGLVYKLGVGSGRVKPYAGGDVIGAQYYVPLDETGNRAGSRWSWGVRARGGVDLMVQRSFGFNLNVAVGAWTGGDWDIIQKDVRNAGLLPQVSAGTVLAF
jgi:hypothetical protein